MPERTRVLAIHLNRSLVGHLVNFNGRTVFFAAPNYVDDPDRPVLSQAFVGPDPTTTVKLLTNYRSSLTNSSTRLPPFFANLLPEGALRTRIVTELRVHEDAEFDILAALGRDLPGAVVAELTREVPVQARAFFGDRVTSDVSLHVGRSAEKFSLSGVQLKFSVLRDKQQRYVLAGESETGDIIVKIPHPSYPHLPENEYTSMRLAQLAGVETPEFWLGKPEELHLPGLGTLESPFYAIQRFDRIASERVHIEDFAQVLNLRPINKYGQANYDTILKILLERSRDGWRDARQLVRRLVVNLLLGNGDAHVKNFSLIYRNPRRPDLAPAYDVVSTVQYLPDDETVALNLAGEKHARRLSPLHFEEAGRRIGLPRPSRLAHEARDTAAQARATWPDALVDLPAGSGYRQRVLERLRTLPISCS